MVFMEMREEKQRRHSDYLMCRYNAVTRDQATLLLSTECQYLTVRHVFNLHIVSSHSCKYVAVLI